MKFPFRLFYFCSFTTPCRVSMSIPSENVYKYKHFISFAPTQTASHSIGLLIHSIRSRLVCWLMWWMSILKKIYRFIRKSHHKLENAIFVLVCGVHQFLCCMEESKMKMGILYGIMKTSMEFHTHIVSIFVFELLKNV